MPPVTDRQPRLFLIRHGDTEWTNSRRHTGLTDIPLTAAGEQRARDLAARLAGENFSRVFTSPLQRAKRTSELAGFADRAEIDPDLVEWDYGDFEALTTVQIISRQRNWNLFRDGCPNGETPSQVAARADRFIAKVRTIGGDIAAFSSGHAIRMIAARWLGLDPLDAKCFSTNTASINILGYEHTLEEPVILRWNDDR